jgi:large subunit ribosomal protein L10
MKKIGLLFKETSENRIKNSLKESDSVFIIKYSKISSPDITTLRQSLKNVNAALFVVKNTVARRALKESALESLIDSIEGPCGLVFVKEEPARVSKVLYKFSREHESVKLGSGFLKDKIIDTKDIVRLSQLPSREILITQTLIALKSPISGLVIVLSQTLRKFVLCLEKIKQKKAGG